MAACIDANVLSNDSRRTALRVGLLGAGERPAVRVCAGERLMLGVGERPSPLRGDVGKEFEGFRTTSFVFKTSGSMMGSARGGLGLELALKVGDDNVRRDGSFS